MQLRLDNSGIDIYVAQLANGDIAAKTDGLLWRDWVRGRSLTGWRFGLGVASGDVDRVGEVF